MRAYHQLPNRGQTRRCLNGTRRRRRDLKTFPEKSSYDRFAYFRLVFCAFNSGLPVAVSGRRLDGPEQK